MPNPHRTTVLPAALLLAALILPACKKDDPPERADVVRPVKLFAVSAPTRGAGRTYPGTVRPNEEAVLAFQVSGRLIEYPITRGMLLSKGDLIGGLDPRDYQNDLNAAQASLDYENNRLDRIKIAVEKEAVSQLELVEQQSKADSARAQRDIAQKALDDTRLVAPYDGIVVDKVAEQFEDLRATQPVVAYQSTDFIKIEIDVPEGDLITIEESADSEPAHDRHTFTAQFPNLPNRTFDLELREYVSEADPVTRTYRAQLVMPSPNDALILPGMTASVLWVRADPATARKAHVIPISATFAHEEGFRVWLIDRQTMTTASRPVTLGEVVGENEIQVIEGLSEGDLIATAGVHWIREGTRVRPLDEKPTAAN